MNNKKVILILVLFLVVGFASVSTALIITGVVGISSKQEDFNVIFTNAILDGEERKDFIDEADKQLLNFETNVLTTLGTSTTLNYEVTNASRNYDAKVTITCDLVDDADQKITSEYVTMDYNPKEMTVVAGENETGSITATLNKTITADKDIRVKCTLDAKPLERTSLGVEYKEPKTYELAVDKNNNGRVDIGDEIIVGTESFYVISNNDTEINALAKYNLNVGSNKNPKVTEGIQHETVRGYISSATYGNVIFSNSKGWGTTSNYTIDIKQNDGPVKKALYGENGYEKYVQAIIPTSQVRLMTKEELEALINDGEDLPDLYQIKNKADVKGYSWLYNTAYWLGSWCNYNKKRVWGVGNDSLLTGDDFNWGVRCGIRPVITIPLS